MQGGDRNIVPPEIRMQYEALREEFMHFDRTGWQMPAIILALVAGVFLASSELIKQEEWGYLSLLFLAGGIAVLALTIDLGKYRLALEHRYLLLNEIEIRYDLYQFHLKSKDQIKVIKRLRKKDSPLPISEFWLNMPSFNYLFKGLLAIASLLVIAFFYTLYRIDIQWIFIAIPAFLIIVALIVSPIRGS